MESKYQSEQKELDQNSLRYRLLPLITINTPKHPAPLSHLQLALNIFTYFQFLKFPIDYSTSIWLGSTTPVFIHLDPSYYTRFLNSEGVNSLLIILMIVMNGYYLLWVVLHLLGVEFSEWMVVVRKCMYLFAVHLGFAPSFRILLGMFSQFHELHPSYSNVPVLLQVTYIISFLLFSTFLALQIQINFQFLSLDNSYTIIRKSCQIPLFLFRYYMACELTATITSGTVKTLILTGMTLILLFFILWMDEIKDQNAKVIELASVCALIFSYLTSLFIQLTGLAIDLYIFIFLAAFLVAGILQIRPYSLRFQLENINKWPTAAIMLRYAGTISYYLSRRDEYLFRVWMHGYMEIHRQKCDNIACPSRCTLTERENKIIQSHEHPELFQQILRINNIIKVIFTAGYRLSPIPAQIQLQNSLFLYHSQEHELALRRLLMIQEDELSLSQYYMHQYLKIVIKEEIQKQGRQEFLDLVTQIRLQYEEEELRKKFQKAALLNLQFWSILNDDHPDFQKLNEVATARVKISEDVTSQFKHICAYANSEKITTMYASYLETLQNDEQLLMDINANLEQEYRFNDQIRVQDWSNSSTAIILISLEAGTQGKILEINAPCATIFGYQKHSLINQSVSNLYPDNFYSHERCTKFSSSETNHQKFMLIHKNGHLITLKKRARTYNSMAFGLSALVEIEPEINNFSCYLLIDSNKKIISSSASLISILDIDLKNFEGDACTYHFFLTDPITFDSDTAYPLEKILKASFITQASTPYTYSIQHESYHGAHLVEIKRICKNVRDDRVRKQENVCTMFEFKLQASRKKFVFVGGSYFIMKNLKQFKPFKLPKQHKSIIQATNFAEGISTLRLQNNVIQYIEEVEQEEGEFKRKEEHHQSALESIPRRSEEEIFASKRAYQNFLEEYKIGKKVPIFLVALMTVIFLLYLVCYIVASQQLQTIQATSSELVYQNLIIGAISHQARYIHEFELQINNLTTNTPQVLIQNFNDNLLFLQEIQLKGSKSFSLQINVSNSITTMLTSQYLATLINYGTQISSVLGNLTTVSELKTAINSINSYNLNFILSADQAKLAMQQALINRQAEIKAEINANSTTETLFLALGLITLVIAAVILIFYFQRLNYERQKVFDVFLDISQPLIQSFSSKTERFLISLHSEDSADVVEEEHEVKKNSSSFAKKKSFKAVSFNKLFYIKTLLVLLVISAFFIQHFILSDESTNFQSRSVDYFGLTSKGDYVLASTADHIAEAYLSNSSTIDLALQSQSIRYYYQNYMERHEQTFGSVADFETVYQTLFNSDICQGRDTHFGWVSIPLSCQLPLMSVNGSYLIMTNLYRTIHKESHGYVAIDLTFYSLTQTHLQFSVLSKVQRLLSSILLRAQDEWLQNKKNQMLLGLLLWMGVSVATALIVWGYEVRFFLEEINKIKNILGILPIKLVKNIPRALDYIKNILQEEKKMF